MSEPDIVLEPDSTRIVDTFDVGTDPNNSRRPVQIEPASSTVTLGEMSVELRRVGVGDEVETVTTFGPQQLRMERVGRIQFSPSEESGVLIIKRDDRKTRFASFRGKDFQSGGIISTYSGEGAKSVVCRGKPEPADEASSGVVEVHDAGGETTGRLDGRDGLLELADDGDETGELILVGGEQEEVDDVYIHATGKSESERVVDAANHPRIALEGRHARLELGREELGDNREADAGCIKFNYDAGGTKSTFLELGTTDGSSLRCGEASFYRASFVGTEPSGSLRGKENLAFHADASPEPMMVVDAGGTVTTQSGIQEGTLDKVPPSVSPDRREISQGETSEFEVVVGDGETIEFTIQSGSYYILQAFLETGSDARVRLRFDTDAAGQETPDTIEVVGDTTVDILEETNLDDPLEPGSYDLTFVDPHGEENATVEVNR
ncbi:MAG: hypothetical protein V5A55_01920 [Halovenus sp.]